MLDSLDVLIGFTLIMLIMSMAVTMLTELIGSRFELRGRALKIGVARLIALLDRGLTPQEAKQIADHILRNPLIGGQPTILRKRHRLASVVHREELVKLILDFAAEGDIEKADPHETTNEARLRAKVLSSLKENGIDRPAETIDHIRKATLELEKTSPELSHSIRVNIAILHFADSQFLAKLNSWFDQTVDRVSDVFTARIRLLTAAVAILLSLALQLDSISIINRLSVDDDLRQQLVGAAINRVQESGARSAPPPAAAPDVQATVDAIRKAGVADLEEFGLVSVPRSLKEWCDGWSVAADTQFQAGQERQSRVLIRLFGILLSAALLSLGAPFWYATLRDFLKLRSMIARKDDAERAERQTTQAPAAGGTLPPQLRGGEAGDLEAAG